MVMGRTNEEFKCQRCGRCCKVFQQTLTFEEEDLERWRCAGGSRTVPSNLGPRPILDFVCFYGDGWGDLWFHPETREDLLRCPFLRRIPKTNRYRCMVYPIRPEICRPFPFIHDGKLETLRIAICPEARRLVMLHPELEDVEDDGHR